MSMNNPLFGRIQLQNQSIKNLVEWGDHFSVEHPEIDAQHKALFDLGGSILENWRNGESFDTLRSAVDKFSNLLSAHFSYEEKVLAEIGYSSIDEHIAEHRSMLKEMAIVRDEFNRIDENGKLSKGSMLAPGWPATQLILGFIIGHVSTSDMSYCRSINESRKGCE